MLWPIYVLIEVCGRICRCAWNPCRHVSGLFSIRFQPGLSNTVFLQMAENFNLQPQGSPSRAPFLNEGHQTPNSAPSEQGRREASNPVAKVYWSISRMYGFREGPSLTLCEFLSMLWCIDSNPNWPMQSQFWEVHYWDFVCLG